MGWCSAFGPQIREGCDHAMVASQDSCSCAECGAVCHGLFPGCTTVWAAGPRHLALIKPGKELGNLMPASTPPPAPAPTPAVPHATFMDQAEMHGLRVDMQLLMWKFDQFREATPTNDQLAKVVAGVAATIETAVATALETQSRASRRMLGEFERRVLADIDQLQHDVTSEFATADAAVTISDLDTRFTWLVEAVSERFVALGNEIARLVRGLDIPPDRDPGA
jgi:hypothetical protein